MDGAAAPIDAPVVWAEVTSSPVAAIDPPRDALERAVLARCGAGDEGLSAAARETLSRALRGLPMPDPDALAFAQRSAGEPHPWARAWVASAKKLSAEATLRKLDAWLSDDPTPPSTSPPTSAPTLPSISPPASAEAEATARATRRCAVASGDGADGTHAVAVVAVDDLAELAPLPTRGRTGQWLTVEARLRVPVRGGAVLVMGPSGSPRRVPAWIEGNVLRARFALDRPGAFAVQVLAATASGPRPVVEAAVFADVAPPSHAPETRRADEGLGVGDDEALARMLAAVRAADGEPPLARDARLDAVARAHAATMAASRAVAHDDGDGDPASRLLAAGLDARASGENVAHAASVAEAHHILWESPSHRANMLRREFDRVGIAVVRDDRGEAWVVETFACGLL